MNYVYPPTSLLTAEDVTPNITADEINGTAERIQRLLKSSKAETDLIDYTVGAAFTSFRYAVYDLNHAKKIKKLKDDLSFEFFAPVRVTSTYLYNGRAAINIEVPNQKTATVSLKAIAESDSFKSAKGKLTVALGRNADGAPVLADLHDMPHLLIAGQTKSGKSVSVTAMILSLLLRVSPDEVKLLLIDPKRVEYEDFSNIPHLAAPIIYDPNEAISALKRVREEMDRRFDLLKKYATRSYDDYAAKAASEPTMERFPRLVIIIDEIADLILSHRTDTENAILSIGAKARAVGIHLVICTQRPDSSILTGAIKQNIPSRIAFKTASAVDARVIGVPEAEILLGRGDMLYLPAAATLPIRVQGIFVSAAEVKAVTDFVIAKNGGARFGNGISVGMKKTSTPTVGTAPSKNDPLLMHAIELTVANKTVSTSWLQRTLCTGYSRTAKLLDRMEEMGIISAPNGASPRTVLMTEAEFEAWKKENT